MKMKAPSYIQDQEAKDSEATESTPSIPILKRRDTPTPTSGKADELDQDKDKSGDLDENDDEDDDFERDEDAKENESLLKDYDKV